MALYSRREFIELCGHDWNDSAKSKIAMWVKRGNVVEVNGKIDDTNPTNRDWAIKQRDSLTLKIPTNEPGPESAGNEAGQGDLFPGESLEQQLKRHQIGKLKVDTRIQELKEEKIRGDVVPIDIMKDLFRVHTQSIVTSQKDAIEELLINLAAEVRMPGESLARMRGKMVEALNNGVDKAIIITERSMKAMVDEFSIKKEVGEHD